MATLVDVSIGILIIFITVMPFVWKGTKSKYVLISLAIICIALFIFQGYSKYYESKKIKTENLAFREELNKQQRDIIQTQRMVIEKQDIFQALLHKLQEGGTISKDAARRMRNIYDETLSVTGKSFSKVEDRFLLPLEAAGEVELKEATLSFDRESNLLWAIPKISACTWDRAVEYAKNFHMGGYSDWRLPSSSEAKLIINNLKGSEATLEVKKRFEKLGYPAKIRGAPFLKLEKSYYWIVENHDSFARAFHPYTGNSEESVKTSINFVVLVRTL